MSAHWKLDGLCTRVGRPDDWFPQGGRGKGAGRAGRERDRSTARVCQGCPVIERCLSAALENGEQYGIWGGLTTDERNRIIKTRAKDAA